MRRLPVLITGLLFLVVVFALSAHAATNANRSATPPNATATIDWLPIHVPAANEVWLPTTNGDPTWLTYYAKQANQITFKLCAFFYGDGTAYVTYGDAGDPYYFDYAQPTAMCITTDTGFGGGTVPLELAVYLAQHGATSPTITSPNLFISSQ